MLGVTERGIGIRELLIALSYPLASPQSTSTAEEASGGLFGCDLILECAVQ